LTRFIEILFELRRILNFIDPKYIQRNTYEFDFRSFIIHRERVWQALPVDGGCNEAGLMPNNATQTRKGTTSACLVESIRF
jgi:hypothetical protein